VRGNDFEFQPPMDGGEGTGNSGNEPDGDSSEDVAGQIEQNEEMLREAGKLSDEGLSFTTSPEALVDDQTEVRFVESIKIALDNVGLYNANDITEEWLEEKLEGVDPEILRSLSPHTAESLYFYTFKKARKWLGNEPIRASRIINQAEFIHSSGSNLETYQLLQRLRDLEFLTDLGISSGQLLVLLGGNESQKQNINRLGFLLSSEPRLRKYVKGLRDSADYEEDRSVEATVIESQEILKKELADIEGKSAPEVRRHWDTVSTDLYKRTVHRIKSSIKIGDIILQDMRDINGLTEAE
jgi:hypothetical protein